MYKLQNGGCKASFYCIAFTELMSTPVPFPEPTDSVLLLRHYTMHATQYTLSTPINADRTLRDAVRLAKEIKKPERPTKRRS